MAYLSVVDLVRSVANSVNPNGTFTHARVEDTSLEFDGPSPQIFLLPLKSDEDKSVVNFETWSAEVLFLTQDEQDSSPERREEIMGEMDELSRIFTNEIYEADGFQFGKFSKRPLYRVNAGTYTGWMVSFTVNTTTSPC